MTPSRTCFSEKGLIIIAARSYGIQRSLFNMSSSEMRIG